MNIKDAKEQVKNTVKAYLAKDRYGEYRIPVNRQRPLFLIGAPGIGKTDIMSQVAGEMDIALVSYSMTHHTRQSALGLPFIKDQMYGGREYRTTEYTMSEIIASVYDAMEETGKKEGILFLDEINCISETLAPSMLQFLQTKKFGKHDVPDGWVIVTAGNPPEYNNSVREFDLATMDRLKEIYVEPDLDSWKEYARSTGVHGSILAYLDVHPKDFYYVTTSLDGREFVTARGWVDLSEMIHIYEDGELNVDYKLITQYVHSERIARDFAAFYDMFFKYKSEYRIKDILEGEQADDVISKAKMARFDEKLMVVQQIADALENELQEVYLQTKGLQRLLSTVKEHKEELSKDAVGAVDLLKKIESDEIKSISVAKKSGTLSTSELQLRLSARDKLHEMIHHLELNKAKNVAANILVMDYIEPLQQSCRTLVSHGSDSLENAFGFVKSAYGDGKEMLLFVTGLSKSRYCADFILNYGSEEYMKHSANLKMYKREAEIAHAAQNLGI